MANALSDTADTERIDVIGRRPVAWWPVGLIAVGTTLLLLITASRYDYHRDELYFRMLGRHLQWGYVDQPPFTPLLGRLGIEIFGDTVWAMRVPFAIILGLVVLLSALIAREAGGGAAAQTIAAAGVVSVVPLSAAHVASTAAPDLLVWLAVILFVIRALLGGRERAWLAAGVTAGLGLYNKHLIVLLLLCLGTGLLIAGPREVFRSRWLWAGVVACLLVGSPNLIYQAVSGFPQAEMAAAIAGDRPLLIPMQFVLLILPPVWIAGIVVLLRDRRLRAIRSLAVAYPLMLLLLLAMGGQSYYPIGLLLALFAIGAVPAGRWATGAKRYVTGIAVAVFALLAIVSSLPVLPEDEIGESGIAEVNETVADQIGWRDYVWQIGGVYAGLSEADQRKAVLFTGNYGEAGALDRYGRSLGLPAVYSGHNELRHFGPPPDGRTVVVAVLQAPPRHLGECSAEARLRNTAGVVNEELDAQVYVCRLDQPWSVIWPRLAHYD
ncbi:glycosyltransferase family 39 protein [Actinoplanes sp. OR16]|uniref:glycosyltransferase family 39 protein n=1 Tax=Actinoplanes sp. OR16 TaxID=946334 RepID=UPI000FD787CC|nr:glycosyltransferase family 39 protein [Actinoplanes sp. OR16]